MASALFGLPPPKTQIRRHSAGLIAGKLFRDERDNLLKLLGLDWLPFTAPPFDEEEEKKLLPKCNADYVGPSKSNSTFLILPISEL